MLCELETLQLLFTLLQAKAELVIWKSYFLKCRKQPLNLKQHSFESIGCTHKDKRNAAPNLHTVGLLFLSKCHIFWVVMYIRVDLSSSGQMCAFRRRCAVCPASELHSGVSPGLTLFFKKPFKWMWDDQRFCNSTRLYLEAITLLLITYSF